MPVGPAGDVTGFTPKRHKAREMNGITRAIQSESLAMNLRLQVFVDLNPAIQSIPKVQRGYLACLQSRRAHAIALVWERPIASQS